MYSQLEPDTSGFGDSRMTASSTPSTTPTAIAMAVSSIVTRSPSRIRSSNRYSPTTPHSKRGLLTTERTIATATRRITAAATQRPG